MIQNQTLNILSYDVPCFPHHQTNDVKQMEQGPCTVHLFEMKLIGCDFFKQNLIPVMSSVSSIFIKH